MPTIRQIERCAEKASNYIEFRELVWAAQGKTSQTDANTKLYPTKKKPCVFVPKKSAFLKDLFLFHPNSLSNGVDILVAILKHPVTIRNVDLRVPNGAVYVDYLHQGGSHILENQEEDDRQAYRGR
jgi:hypothetical protein